MEPSKRDHIKELLIDLYWKEEADAIIDSALARDYTLDDIAQVLTTGGTDILILNTTWRTMVINLDA